MRKSSSPLLLARGLFGGGTIAGDVTGILLNIQPWVLRKQWIAIDVGSIDMPVLIICRLYCLCLVIFDTVVTPYVSITFTFLVFFT